MFRTLLFALLFFGTFSYGQKGAALPNNCTSAIEVCGSEVIVSNSSGTGTQELSASNTCSSQEHNSLWLRLEIIQGGTLGFDLTPESNDIEVDYDFFLFGPKVRCDSIGQAIRCSTTNPAMANLSHNRTGMKNSEGDTSEGPGPNGNSYVKSVDVLPGEVYFLVIDRPIGNSPFQLEWTGSATQGSGAFKEGPTANKAPDLERCSISGIADFDLSAQNTSINTNSSMQISYHDSRADAIDNIDSLPNTYTSNKPLQEIFARVFNPLTKCFSISSFTLRVRGAPNIATPTPLQVCDSNANSTEIFDLNRKNIEILNGLSAASNTISFHATEAEANIRANPLPLLYNSGEITIYARVEDNIEPDCFAVVPLALELWQLPNANNYTLVQCDIDSINSTDGITSINLEQAHGAIGNNQQGLQYFFYESVADRNADNPIPNPNNYTNLIDNQVLQVKTINSNGCENFSQLTIDVVSTFSSVYVSRSFYACDEKPNSPELEATFDLEEIRNNYPSLDVYLYATKNDATLEKNALRGMYVTTTTNLFVRLESNNQCQGVEQIRLKVEPTPEVLLEDTYLLCTNAPPLILRAQSGFHHYKWIKLEEGNEIVLGNQPEIALYKTGNYRLYLAYSYTNNGNSYLCENTKDFVVEPSNNATFSTIHITDFQENNNRVEVLVTGDGDYEYSIDNYHGPYKNENVFDGVKPGIHTVFVRDKNGCGISEREIAIIGYPKFFSPNGDGINDSWQLFGINQKFYTNTMVFIYNRYGKLITKLDTTNPSWDGLFNGAPLPSSDYWFKIYLEDGRQYKGNFALIR